MATSLQISIADPLKAHLDAQIEAGAYGDASEYVSELIQHDRERLRVDVASEVAKLEARLLRSINDTEGIVELSADEVRAGGVVALLRERLRAA